MRERGKKKQPAAPAPAASTRRTRANPSPGGLKELPATTARRRGHPREPRKKAEADEVASAPLARSTEDNTAQSTTSRSRSPEPQSESPEPQAPESRSTSPPNDLADLVIASLPTPRQFTSTQGQQSGPKRFGVADKLAASRKRYRNVEKDEEQPRPAKRVRAHLEMSSPFSSSDEDDIPPQPHNSMFYTARRATRQRQTVSSARPNAMLTINKWAESDPTRPMPSSDELTAFLDNWNQHRIMRERHPQRMVAEAGSATNQHQDRAETLEIEYSLHNQEQADLGDAEDGELKNERSEVHTESQVPETPTTVARPQGPHGLWNGLSAVKNLIATPLNYFRRPGPSADAANGTPVPSEFTFRHSHNLPAPPEIITTPSRPNARRLGAQTERGGRHQTPQARFAQTERRSRPVAEVKPPMHLRHITTPAVLAEIQRQQQRMKSREAQNDPFEDMDDDHHVSMHTAQAGEKRKHPHTSAKTPSKVFSNSFRVPSPTSSDEDDDDDDINDQIEHVEPFQREAYRAASLRGETTPVEKLAGFGRSVQVVNDDPNNGRVPPYTGSIARQPPAVQANIDEGLAPLAPRLSTTRHKADGNVFTTTTESQDEEEPLCRPSGPRLPDYKYNPWSRHDPNIPKKRYEDYSYVKAVKGENPSGSIRGWFERNDPETLVKADAKVAKWKEELLARKNNPTTVNGDVDASTVSQSGDSEVQASKTAEPSSSFGSGFSSGSRSGFGSGSGPGSYSSKTTAPSGGLFARINRDANGNPIRQLPSDEKENTLPSAVTQTTDSQLQCTKTSSGASTVTQVGDGQLQPGHTSTGSGLGSNSSKIAVTGDGGTSAASSTLDSSAPGPLASKKWDQTPPPKPQPRNAELPQQLAPNNQELGDQAAKPAKPQTLQEQALRSSALKYAPVRPSNLRQMTQMSPLQQQIEDKENTKFEKQAGKSSAVTASVPNIEWDSTLFSKEIDDLIKKITEENIVAMPLPAYLYEGWQQSEVEKEVDKLFQ